MLETWRVHVPETNGVPLYNKEVTVQPLKMDNRPVRTPILQRLTRLMAWGDLTAVIAFYSEHGIAVVFSGDTDYADVVRTMDLADGLLKQDKETLEDVREYVDELLKYKEQLNDQPIKTDDLSGPVEIIEEGSKGPSSLSTGHAATRAVTA